MAGTAMPAMRAMPTGAPTSVPSCQRIFFFLLQGFFPQNVQPEGLRGEKSTGCCGRWVGGGVCVGTQSCLTLNNAGRRSPSCRASKTHSHTQRRSCGYNYHRSFWWCKQRSGGKAWCRRLKRFIEMLALCKGCWHWHEIVHATWGSTLLAVTERGGPETPQPWSLSPLLPRRVTRLVGVPQLFAMVAELRPAAVTPTGYLWTAGTAEGNDRVAKREGGGGSTVGKFIGTNSSLGSRIEWIFNDFTSVKLGQSANWGFIIKKKRGDSRSSQIWPTILCLLWQLVSELVKQEKRFLFYPFKRQMPQSFSQIQIGLIYLQPEEKGHQTEQTVAFMVSLSSDVLYSRTQILNLWVR